MEEENDMGVRNVSWNEKKWKFALNLSVEQLQRMRPAEHIDHVLFQNDFFRLVLRFSKEDMHFHIRLPGGGLPARCNAGNAFIFRNICQPHFFQCTNCLEYVGEMYATCTCCGVQRCLECVPGVLPSGKQTITVHTTRSYHDEKSEQEFRACFDMSTLQRLQMSTGEVHHTKDGTVFRSKMRNESMHLEFNVRIDYLDTIKSILSQQCPLQGTPPPQGMALFQFINSNAGKVSFAELPCRETDDNGEFVPFSRRIAFKCANDKFVYGDTYTIKKGGPEGLNALIGVSETQTDSTSGEIQVDMSGGYEVYILHALLKAIYTQGTFDLTEVQEDSRIHFLHHLFTAAHGLGMADSDVRHMRELYSWLLEAIGNQLENETEQTLESILQTAKMLDEYDLKSKIHAHLSRESKKEAQKKKQRDQDATATESTERKEKKQKSSSEDTEPSTLVWNWLTGN